MSLLIAAALATAAPTAAGACSWDRPGHNPFTGDVVAAVDRYTDIPADVRAALKARMASRSYDEMATIRRDSITGRQRYGADLRQMHFGSGQVCNTVTRARWSDTAVERGLVYCEGEHCLIVPTVCRNVSRVTRLPADRRADGDGPVVAAGPPAGELSFDPPGAGPAQPSGGDGGGGGGGPTTFAQGATVPGPGFGGPVGGDISAPGADGGTGGGGVGPTFAPLPQTQPSSGLPAAPLITAAVPEPATWLLLLGGVAGLRAVARRRGRRPTVR